jgi:hypothetical protein
MIRTMSVLLFALILSASTGCATLLRGDSQKMTFQTDPAGASIIINDKDYKAPAEVRLKRREEYKITVTAPGHQAIVFNLRANWDGATLGNIIMPGGSVGFGVDFLNGADRSFTTLATIKLKPTTEANIDPTQMFVYRGRVVSKAEFDQALIDDQKYRADTGTPP